MQSFVSRRTITESGEILVDGIPACAKCLQRPRRPYPQRNDGRRRRRYYSYCGECHAEYQRQTRSGMLQRLVTAEEWAAIKAARDRAARRRSGRHAAA